MTDQAVAIVHDYLTQTGGAERVVLSMRKAFPDAPIYTSVFEPDQTFPEFQDADVRPMALLNSVRPLRRDHRIGLPIYATAFRHLEVPAQQILCSSSGWSHHVTTPGRKVVYCHTPARWLYQAEVYKRHQTFVRRVGLQALSSRLRAADWRAARSADLYIANSSVVRRRIQRCYGLEATLLFPPPAVTADGAVEPLQVPERFLLVVSRLLPYKNVDQVIRAARRSEQNLVVVGRGPEEARLRNLGQSRVVFFDRVSDEQLRFLYQRCTALVTASYEDFGLVALEANSFGVPVAALRFGGFLDTVRDGITGVLFEQPTSAQIAAALEEISVRSWDPEVIQHHAEAYSEARFVARLQELILGKASASQGAE